MLAKEERGDYPEHVKRIIDLIQRYGYDISLSVEVFSADPAEMIAQAEEFVEHFGFYKNSAIKVPIGWDELAVIRELRGRDIQVNCTACMSYNQAMMAAMAGANFVSLFFGRIKDMGYDAAAIVRQVHQTFREWDAPTFMPGDNEVTLDSIRDILACVGSADVVVPYHGTPWKREWHRRLLTWICTNEINVLMGHNLRYFQGPAVYPTMLARVLPNTTRGFFFATEMLVYALAAGYSWIEVPLEHQPRAFGESKAVGWSTIVDAERFLLELWWNVRVLRRGILRGPVRALPQLAPAAPAPAPAASSTVARRTA